MKKFQKPCMKIWLSPTPHTLTPLNPLSSQEEPTRSSTELPVRLVVGAASRREGKFLLILFSSCLSLSLNRYIRQATPLIPRAIVIPNIRIAQ